MFSKKELNPKDYTETPEVAHNLDTLCKRLNLIITNYGKPLHITSGLRSRDDQLRINPAAMHSKHLTGEAADILDVDGDLKKHILANKYLLELAKLWCEDFGHTSTWVHFQIVPPKSGKRFFIP